jgi:hypothetical protein
MFYQQQHLQNDFRQLFTRLTEKMDVLTEKVFSYFLKIKIQRKEIFKIDIKNSTHPNMETSILLSNIQRIVKVYLFY